MNYYIIAGEASGDLHGSNLIKKLKQSDKNANVRCWGGDLMEVAGGNVVKHYRDLAFMGFIEVISNLPTILKNLSYCKKDILEFKPDALILIDYPGFNLRIAKWAKLNGFKVIYYISPQVWAWKEKRVNIIQQYVDKMLVILPFEKDFYQKWNYDADYVGHPLVEVINTFLEKKNTHEAIYPGNKKIIALLPGSRKQEILKKLPIMLEVAEKFKDYQFVVAKAPGLDENFYHQMLTPYKNVTSVVNKTYQLLSESSAALVTSGTATLETALFRVPQIICYKGNKVSYQIAKKLIKIKFIGLVNLIMDKPVVKELIQNELTVENLSNELRLIIENETYRNNILNDYDNLKSTLSKGGDASLNAANIIVKFLQQQGSFNQ